MVAQRMQTIKLTLEYDGSSYHGFQRQKNALTIQQCLEKALAVFFQEKITVVSCGRTDSGVHARGHVVSFSVARRRDLAVWAERRRPVVEEEEPPDAAGNAVADDGLGRINDVAPRDSHGGAGSSRQKRPGRKVLRFFSAPEFSGGVSTRTGVATFTRVKPHRTDVASARVAQ